MTRYLVIIEENEDGSGLGAYLPHLPGCVESLRAPGKPVPPPIPAAGILEVAA